MNVHAPTHITHTDARLNTQTNTHTRTHKYTPIVEHKTKHLIICQMDTFKGHNTTVYIVHHIFHSADAC